MSRLLDTSRSGEIADAVTDMLTDEGGYSTEEMIPGLVQAIIDLANSEEQLLDEAIDLLANNMEVD
jgi:hypothetical protein